MNPLYWDIEPSANQQICQISSPLPPDFQHSCWLSHGMTFPWASTTLRAEEEQENTLLIFHTSNFWNLLSEVLNHECKH